MAAKLLRFLARFALSFLVLISGCVRPAPPPQGIDFFELNSLFLRNPHREFNGVFAGGDFFLIGFKDLQTGQIEMVNTAAPDGVSVHSHPSGVCVPSQADIDSVKILGEETFCILCGVNNLACYSLN